MGEAPDTVDAVLRARWHAVGLPGGAHPAAARTAAAEVHRLGAVQAQEFEMTLWSLGRRTGEDRAQVLGAFESGEVVRVHALRPTWHFVHRDDLERVQAATAHRVHRRHASVYRDLALDPGTLARASAVIVDAAAAEPVTRPEVGRRLEAAGIAAPAFRLGILMMWAELECLVVNGPLRGRQHTYVAWERRSDPDPDESAAWLAERYLASHGPATLGDLCAWSSLTTTQARRAVAGLPLGSAHVEGVELHWLGRPAAGRWRSPQVELLNGYDEYVSGLSAAGKRWLDRAGLARERLGTPVGVAALDGQLAGHWRRTQRAGAVEVEVHALRRLDDAEVDALRRNAEAYGAFLGLPVRLRVSTVPGT